MASSNHQPNNNSSAQRSIHSQVHDAVSVTRDKFADVVSHIQKPETRQSLGGLKDGWDAMVKVMFAPCAGDIGGVPREEMGMATPPRAGPQSTSGRSRSAANGGANAATTTPPWGASVPFEVAASQQDRSLLQGPLSVSAAPHAQDWNESNAVAANAAQHYPLQQQRLTPREQRLSTSRAKLRQLGARHQLAGGFPGESLADTARPISPGDKDEFGLNGNSPESPELVDFDDGISAISSHTLEEMERRRAAKEKRNVVRLHPLDFSQIIDEETELKYTETGRGPLGLVQEEVDEKNTEVVFGEPFYEEEDDFQKVDVPPAPADLNRVASTRTHQTLNTTITDEESHEFEEMYQRHEAMYWVDSNQVASTERMARGSRRMETRPSRGMSIEERARRLRELSRSRSRSDGTGSVSAFEEFAVMLLVVGSLFANLSSCFYRYVPPLSNSRINQAHPR